MPFAFAAVVSAVELRVNFVLLGMLQSDRDVGLFSAASRFTKRENASNAFFGALFLHFGNGSAAEIHLRRARWGSLRSGCGCLGFSVLSAPILSYSLELYLQARKPPRILAWSLVPALINGLTLLYLYAKGTSLLRTRCLRSRSCSTRGRSTFIRLLGPAGAAFSSLVGDITLFLLLSREWRSATCSLAKRFGIPLLVFLVAHFFAFGLPIRHSLMDYTGKTRMPTSTMRIL